MNWQKIFKDTNIKINLLTGKTNYKERKDILSKIKEGKTQFLIGTLYFKKLILNN